MDKIKPSKKWIALTFLFSLLMIILMSATSVWYQSTVKQYFNPADTPIISIEQGGKYGLYYEYQISNKLNENITVFFRNMDTDTTVQSKSTNKHESYRTGNLSGELIGVVYLSPGKYEITSDYEQGGAKLDFILRKGNPLSIMAFFTIMMLISLNGGLGMIFLRVKAKRRIERERRGY